MPNARYSNLISSLAIEVALAENEGKSAAVVKSVEKNAFKVQAALDRINAKGPNAQMEVLSQTVKELGGIEKMTTEQSRILGQELQQLAKRGAAVPTALAPAIASFEKLRTAEKQAGENKQALQDAFTSKLGLGTGVANLAPAAGGLLAVGAMAGAAKETYELIKASAALADQISDLSKEYQVSTDEIQTWQKIQKDTGVTVEAIGSSVTNLSKLLVNSPDKFKAWGMDVEKLRSLAPEQLLGEVGKRLQELNSKDRLTFVEDFKIANELMPHLLAGFDDLREKAASSISPLDARELDNLKKTHDAVTKLGTAWSDMWLEVGNALGADQQVQEFLTEIKDGMVALVKFIADNREELAFGAKMVAAMAGGDVVGVGKASAGYLSAKAQSARLAATLAREQGIWGSDVKVGYGSDGAGGPGGPSEKIDLAAIEEARKKKVAAEKAAAAETKQAWLEANREIVDDLNDRNREHERLYKARTDAALQETERLLKIIKEDAPRLAGEQESAEYGWVSDFMQKKYAKDLFDEQETAEYGYGGSRIEMEKKATVEWSALLNDVANQLSAMGQTGTAIGKILGGMSGIGAMFEKDKDGKNAFSGGLGLKSITAGISGVFAAFDIGKTLFGMLHKTEAQKVAFDVGRDYGVKISEGLAEELAKTSKTRGRDVSSLLSLDKIVGEAGGVSGFGLDKTIAKMRDLFSMIQVGKMTAEEARKPFDALFGEVAAASISKTTGLISAQAKELMAYGQSIGSESVKAFQGEQRDKAAGYLERLSKNESAGVGGDGSFLGGALGAVYARLREQGLSTSEIAEKLGPQIDALAEKFAKAGVTGGEAFAHINEKLAIFRDEATGPIASAIEDSIGLMTALYNSGDLSKQDFISGAAQVGASYAQLKEQLVAMGRDPGEALQAFGSDLQKIWEMQRRFGVEVDATTQGALDEAEAAGMIGPEFMDPLLAEAERTNDILEAGFEGLGADLSGIPERMARAVPTDMSSYGGGSSTTTDLGRSLADALAQGGVTGGHAPIELSGETIGALARALASQPININTQVAIDGGAIIGAVSDQLDRNTPDSQNLKNRF